jgi:hypothetical protein
MHPYVEGGNTLERLTLDNPDGEDAANRLEALEAGLRVAKAAIEKAALDTLWCGDCPAETVCDRIDALLAWDDRQGALALPSVPPSIEAAFRAGWAAMETSIGVWTDVDEAWQAHVEQAVGEDATHLTPEDAREAPTDPKRIASIARSLDAYGKQWQTRHRDIADDFHDGAAIARAYVALSEREKVLERHVDDLQQSEAEYRLMHDRHGDGSRAAGRAWDLMRRAGDKARAALAGAK